MLVTLEQTDGKNEDKKQNRTDNFTSKCRMLYRRQQSGNVGDFENQKDNARPATCMNNAFERKSKMLLVSAAI